MKITLWSLPRTGSTYLYNMLVKYLFNTSLQKQLKYHKLNLNEFSKNYSESDLFNILNNENRWVVKDLLIGTNASESVYEYFNHNSDKIYLTLRKDWFQMISSASLAHITNEWSAGKTYQAKTAEISLDLFFKKFNIFWELLNKNIKFINVDKIIFYEDLKFWIRKDLVHLGLIDNIEDIKPLKSYTNKLKSKKDTILNYNVLYEFYNTINLNNYTSEYFYFDSQKKLQYKK